MNININVDAKEQLKKQINSLYDISKEEIEAINNGYEMALEKLEKSFSHVNNKYYYGEGGIYFNPLHVGQWSMFLYDIAYVLRKQSASNINLCDKIYGLSKCFSSADIFYEVEMPEIWFFDHPQGAVMGKAKYNDFFTFSQGCTVGNNKGKYPEFGRHVSMLSNSKILGNCKIGNYVIFAANSYVIDQDIPSLSLVFGMHPNITVKKISLEKFAELTGSMFKADE